MGEYTRQMIIAKDILFKKNKNEVYSFFMGFYDRIIIGDEHEKSHYVNIRWFWY